MRTERRIGMRGHNADQASGVVASGFRVVEYTLRLELAPAAWDRVAEIIEAAIVAGTIGDLEGVQTATAELVGVSPVRVIKPDGSPTVKAGPEIIERANVLTHILESMRSAITESTSKDSNDR
jgi:hypothetical protein